MTSPTKVVALSLVLLGFGVATPAQDDGQQRLIKLRKEKLAESWLKLAPWITDYDQARAESARTGKAIFAYYTRSFSP